MGKNLFLVGLPGVGKSTVGKILSLRLGKKFIDTDDLIENELNLSILEIFDKFGEDYFRDCESKVISELFSDRDCESEHTAVISLGGGAVLREANRKVLVENGAVVWLKITPEVLIERLKSNNESLRPVIRELSLEFLSELDSIRSPIYEKISNATVEVTDKNPAEIAEEVKLIYNKLQDERI